MKKLWFIVSLIIALAACGEKQKGAQNSTSPGVYKSKGTRAAIACLDKKILIDVKNELGKAEKLDSMRLAGLMEMGTCVPVLGNMNMLKIENSFVSGSKYDFAVIEIPDNPIDEPRYVLLDMIEKSQ